jgi:hypothetical protein
MKVSPNPARRLIRVQADELFEKAVLMNPDGVQVQEWSIPATREAELKLIKLAGGNYWLLLTGRKGASATSVIILE